MLVDACTLKPACMYMRDPVLLPLLRMLEDTNCVSVCKPYQWATTDCLAILVGQCKEPHLISGYMKNSSMCTAVTAAAQPEVLCVQVTALTLHLGISSSPIAEMTSAPFACHRLPDSPLELHTAMDTMVWTSA